jgi:hypothetical protein
VCQLEISRQGPLCQELPDSAGGKSPELVRVQASIEVPGYIKRIEQAGTRQQYPKRFVRQSQHKSSGILPYKSTTHMRLAIDKLQKYLDLQPHVDGEFMDYDIRSAA